MGVGTPGINDHMFIHHFKIYKFFFFYYCENTHILDLLPSIYILKVQTIHSFVLYDLLSTSVCAGEGGGVEGGRKTVCDR